MRSEQLRGDQLLGPAHHRLSFVRVDAVRDPHPVGALQNAEVDPGAAGGTGFDLKTRVGRLDLVQQSVERRGLGVDARTARG
jgi:hypothetical protein